MIVAGKGRGVAVLGVLVVVLVVVVVVVEVVLLELNVDVKFWKGEGNEGVVGVVVPDDSVEMLDEGCNC
jgi:hypothetical protein